MTVKRIVLIIIGIIIGVIYLSLFSIKNKIKDTENDIIIEFSNLRIEQVERETHTQTVLLGDIVYRNKSNNLKRTPDYTCVFKNRNYKGTHKPVGYVISDGCGRIKTLDGNAKEVKQLGFTLSIELEDEEVVLTEHINGIYYIEVYDKYVDEDHFVGRIKIRINISKEKVKTKIYLQRYVYKENY